MSERCIGMSDYCDNKVRHHDEKGVASCCQCWPLAFEDVVVPGDQRCERCPEEAK